MGDKNPKKQKKKKQVVEKIDITTEYAAIEPEQVLSKKQKKNQKNGNRR